MPSEYTPGSHVDPFAPLEHLVQVLVSGAFHLGAGLVLGIVLAHVLRHLRVHWGWPACALAAVVGLQPDIIASPLTSGSALLMAAALNRRWHAHDLCAGEDLARRAHRMHTPVDALRALLRSLMRRRQGSASFWTAGGELMVGHTVAGDPVSIPLGTSAGGTHTLVVGAAGSGKTVTQTWIATRAIERGTPTVVIDPKGDPDLREALSEAAHTHGARFLEWSPAGPSVYNPYADGTDTEIADKVLAAEQFTEPHYMRQAQRFLGHVVRTLRAGGHEVSLAALVRSMEPGALELLAREAHASSTHAYLDSLSARQLRDLGGVRDRLAVMAESDAGRWLDPSAAGAAVQFDLAEVLGSRTVALFSLRADRLPLLAQMLGAAIVQDMHAVIGARQGRPISALAVIDEFSAIATDQVVGLFARARGAGLSMVLGTQEFSDLRLPGRERLVDQVVGNLTSMIAHRQVVPASAEAVSRLAGTVGAWRTSQRSDGSSARQRVLEPRIDPETIRTLPPGWAVVIDLVAGGAEIARIMCASRAVWRDGRIEGGDIDA